MGPITCVLSNQFRNHVILPLEGFCSLHFSSLNISESLSHVPLSACLSFQLHSIPNNIKSTDVVIVGLGRRQTDAIIVGLGFITSSFSHCVKLSDFSFPLSSPLPNRFISLLNFIFFGAKFCGEFGVLL